MDTNKYWVVHGGSDSYFAARDAKDAAELVTMFNKIAMEYDMPPTSRAEIAEDLDFHRDEIERRNKEGDEFYFMP